MNEKRVPRRTRSARAEAEIERLRAALEDTSYPLGEIDALMKANAKLRAALEPFARNVDALSLSKALGHIGREHLLAARDALWGK